MVFRSHEKFRITITLDDSLLEQVDRAAQALGTTRSAFTRNALREALGRLRERDLERRHRAGYEEKPVHPGEFSDWEDEQVWGD